MNVPWLFLQLSTPLPQAPVILSKLNWMIILKAVFQDLKAVLDSQGLPGLTA